MSNKAVLPDFTRWSWASLHEREMWWPLVTSASQAFIELEREAVVAGIRKAAWQFVGMSNLPALTAWAHERDLVVVPKTAVRSGDSYSTTTTHGSPNAFRVVITHADNYRALYQSGWENNDTIGEWLGYPACCRKAFEDTWARGHVDSLYDQYTPTRNHAHSLLRFMGLRLVPHMPCRNDCAASADMASRFVELGNLKGYREEMRFIEEALRWPVTVSRLHGVNELIFEPLKIVTRTDWTAEEEQFAYTDGHYFAPDAGYWKDNGFSTHEGMRVAHQMLLNDLRELPLNARVMDLGCGNGTLLRRLIIHRPDIKIAGVERNEHITMNQHQLLPGKWIAGNISDTDRWTLWSPTVALINPIRLLEMTPSAAARTQAALENIPQLMVYAYSDVLKDRTLEQLTHEAGLNKNPFHLLQRTTAGSVGLVG